MEILWIHCRGFPLCIFSPIGHWRLSQRVWRQECWRIWQSSGRPSLEVSVIRSISVFNCFFLNCNVTSQTMYYLEIYRLQCAWQQCVELVDLPTVFLFFNIQALARLLAQRLTAFLAVCWLHVAETEQYLIKWDHCYHRYLPSLAAFPLQPSSLLNWLMVIGKLTRPGQLLHLILAASKLLDVRPTYSTMNRNMFPLF